MSGRSHSITRIVPSVFLLVLFVALLSPSASAQRPFVSETALQGFYQYTSLVLDGEGQPHIVAWDINNFWLVYATKSDGVWSSETIFANGFAGTTVNIAVDSQDRVHVLWNGFSVGGPEIRYSMRSGGVWSASELIAAGEFASMDLGPDDTPHAFFNQAGNLYYAHRNGGWNVEFVTGSSPGVDYETSCKVDALGRPHVGYANLGNELYYGYKSGSSWTLEDLGTGLGASDIQDHDFALDAQGYPRFVYYNEFFGSHSIVYKTRGETGWNSPELITSQGDVGRYCEMDLDATGQPLVASLNGSPNDLQFWERPDTGWTAVQKVDHVGNTGHYSSMALDEHGNPAISYINNDTGDIYYADSGVRLLSDPVGGTWPVGAQRELSWQGAGAVDLLLSTDGGASYEALAINETGGSNPTGGTYVFTVPHRPSRFCKVQVLRHDPYSIAQSDSFFTIETEISLLNMTVTLPEEQSGLIVSWTTEPGPDDLQGYRLEKKRGSGEWSALVSRTKETSYRDLEGVSGDRYRLFAINGLGDEFYVGEASDGEIPSFETKLAIWPVPFRSGELNISFPTGGPGGASAVAEVVVYDVAGRRVKTVVSRAYPIGVQRATWDGRDEGGNRVASGVYFIRASSGGVGQTRKFVVVR